MIATRLLLSLAASCALTSACAGDLHEKLPEPGAEVQPRADATDTTDTAKTPSAPSYRFEPDIQQDIDALSCSMAGCHGSGLGGFQLTKGATGAELAANFDAFKARALAGEESKVLVKTTGAEPHVGGVRFSKTDAVYRRWVTWIQEGNPR